MRSRMLALTATLTLLVVPALTARAQDWPGKQPIKMIVPFGAGSATDVAGRTVMEQVGRQLKQTVLAENKGGAGTTIGSAAVAKAEPDGYTILVNSTSFAVTAVTYGRLPYDALADFVNVGLLVHLPFTIATRTRYKTLADYVAEGRKQPTPLNYGSNGPGSSGHLFVERFNRAAKMDARHVPFRSTPDAMTEIVADRLDMFPAPTLSALELAAAGKISVLAVTTVKRVSSFPNVPTTLEAGFPDSEYNFWVGAFAPAKTPRAIVERLNAEIGKALADPDVRRKLANLGGEIEPMTLAEFDTFVKKEIALNGDIVKAIRLPPQ